MLVPRLLVLLAATQITKAANAESCESGNCIPLPECDPLLSIFNRRPLTADDAKVLRSFHCGFTGKIPNVCCPLLPRETCGQGTLPKIIGGDKTDLDEFPWMALLEYRRGRKANRTKYFDCGGALINKRYVLTAAHCIKRNLVNVRLGEYDIKNETDCIKTFFDERCAPEPITVPIEEKVVHEGYNETDLNQYHDIALLRLEENVDFSDFVKPICLPTASEANPNINTNLFVAGWGITENRTTSNVKLKVKVPIKDKSDCETIFKSYNWNIDLKTSQLCVGGEKGKDSCRGDSGGPLMAAKTDKNKDLRWFANGVVSFGANPCGMQGWPGVYTKVADYVPWIVSKIRA